MNYKTNIPEGSSGDWSISQFEVTVSGAKLFNLRASIGGDGREISAGKWPFITADNLPEMISMMEHYAEYVPSESQYAWVSDECSASASRFGQYFPERMFFETYDELGILDFDGYKNNIESDITCHEDIDGYEDCEDDEYHEVLDY